MTNPTNPYDTSYPTHDTAQQPPYGQPNPYQAMDKNDSSTGGILSTLFAVFTLSIPVLGLVAAVVIFIFWLSLAGSVL